MPPCGCKQREHLKDGLQHLKQNSRSLWPEMEVPQLQEKDRRHLWMPAFSWSQCLICVGFGDPNSSGQAARYIGPVLANFTAPSPYVLSARRWAEGLLGRGMQIFCRSLVSYFPKSFHTRPLRSSSSRRTVRHKRCSQPTALMFATSNSISDRLNTSGTCKYCFPTDPLLISCNSGAPCHQGFTTPFKNGSRNNFPRQNEISPR